MSTERLKSKATVIPEKKQIYSLGRQPDRETGGKTQSLSDKGLEQILNEVRKELYILILIKGLLDLSYPG